jgi:hypothetical protein
LEGLKPEKQNLRSEVSHEALEAEEQAAKDAVKIR